MKNLTLISFIVFMFVFQVKAQEAQTPSPEPTTIDGKANARALVPQMKVAKAPRGENLLDFEAEVIEGEKKRPELFLDIKAGDGNVGSGLYLRPNYDDFFVVDKKRRPRFVKSK